MAFLRSQKLFRFLSVGKNFINFRDYDVAHQIQPASCICSSQNNFATSANLRSVNQNLDTQLKRLDQDVRRSGRISRRDLEEILEEIRLNKTATSSQSLLVIRCCGNLVPEEKPEIRTKIVHEIWTTLLHLNVPMDISHYNALLRVYLENEYEFSPTEFLAELQSKGVEPNRVTYQRLISRYCQQGDIDGATQILEFMREKQLPVNENVFNALINGHANADDLESAMGIIGVMSQAGLEPSADTYTTLLCGFARKGDIASINKHIAVCEEKEIHLVDKDLLEVVYALAINGHEDKIDSIIEKIQRTPGFNQDAVNIILRLTNKDKVKSAMAVLQIMPRNKRDDGEYTDAGSFLLKQLVKSNKPIEEILNVCQQLFDLQLHSKPVIVALEETLIQSNNSMSLNLLREMKKTGVEIRQHYFWPLLASAKDEAEAFDIMSIISAEFKMEVTGQSIRDYVIPKIESQDYDTIFARIRGAGISAATTCTCVAFSAIKNNDLASAAQIMSAFNAYLSPGLFRKPLLFAVISTKDYENYGKIMRAIHEGVQRLPRMNNSNQADVEEVEEGVEGVLNEAVESGEVKTEKLQAEIMGSFVMDALVNIRSNKLEIVEKILESLVAQGLSISNKKAEQIQNYIGEKMTTELSTLLGKLTSGDLEPIRFERHQIKGSAAGPMQVDALERLITRVDEKGGNTKGMKKQLLIQAIRSKDLPKTEQLIEKLKGEGYLIGSGVNALLFELYTINNKIDEAKKVYEQIKAEDAEFSIDDNKTIKFVLALVENDRFDEAITFLETHKRESVPETPNYAYNNSCWRTLNFLADKGDVAALNKMFDAIVDNNFAAPNNVLLGPLVKVHVVKNEMKEALDKFEEICLKHRATPWKNELACKLIQIEDAENLQRITDLSTDIHGEVNSLYDLVFSFIECGRIRQARKILETPGLRTKTYNRISSICERFAEAGKPNILEGLCEATKDLNHIDRSEIYSSLLSTYIKDKETDKCLEMWTKMQEEDINPTDTFLTKLANYLTSQGVEVPFQKPIEVAPTLTTEEVKKAKVYQSRTAKPSTTTTSPTENRKPVDSNSPIAQLRDGIQRHDDAAIEAFISRSDYATSFDGMTIFEKSKVIEALTRLEKLPEANALVSKMLEKSQYPRLNVFRYYLNRLATKGEIEIMEKIGNNISADMKKELSFDNRLCHSFVSNGKVEEYLQRLEKEIDSVKTPEEIAQAEFKFPRGGSIGLLEVNPEVIDRYEGIARKYAAHNIVGPINVLWIHHFISGDEQKAEKVFKEFLSSSPRLMFHRIVQVAREKNDEQMVNKLITVLKNASHVSEGAMGNAYSALIDIQAIKGNADVVLATIKTAIDSACLENINATALQRAKGVVEKAGKSFPYKIIEKKTGGKQQDSSSSSSSSSSDDEVTKKA